MSTENHAAPDKTVFGVTNGHHTFRAFKQVGGTKEAYKAFKDLADGKGPPFLFCYGGVGNGKTHLLEALAIALQARGMPPRLWVVPELLAYFRAVMDDKERNVDVIIANYQRGGALLLDDLGMEYGTNWEQSVLERIINGRYRNRAITAVTSNRDLDELPERVVSRFFEPGVGIVVLNKGADYRRSDG